MSARTAAPWRILTPPQPPLCRRLLNPPVDTAEYDDIPACSPVHGTQGHGGDQVSRFLATLPCFGLCLVSEPSAYLLNVSKVPVMQYKEVSGKVSHHEIR